MSHPWEDFLAARLRLIHAWAKEGKTPEEICAELNHHDVTQIRLLLRTDPQTLGPSVYTDLEAARQRIEQLEDQALWADKQLAEARSEANASANRIGQVLTLLSTPERTPPV
jgi:hypothetical protein